jgi:hypothetical protein
MIGLREKFGLENTNYPGCRIDGKFIKSGDAESEQISGDSIVITRDKLIKLVTTIVSNILAGNDLRVSH